jgi:hypothetical protein
MNALGSSLALGCKIYLHELFDLLSMIYLLRLWGTERTISPLDLLMIRWIRLRFIDSDNRIFVQLFMWPLSWEVFAASAITLFHWPRKPT